MADNKTIIQKERRQKTRWEIPQSLKANAIISTQQRLEDIWKDTSEQFFQGYLSNICELGAQTILEATCWEQLQTNQCVKLQIDASSCETEIKTEIFGRIKYIMPDEQDNKIRLGIEFLEAGLNDDTKQAIRKISESSGTCSECTFDECPNLL